MPLEMSVSESDCSIFRVLTLVVTHRAVEHERILQTLWKLLTGDKFASPTYGGHWEVIGFQGVFVFCC